MLLSHFRASFSSRSAPHGPPRSAGRSKNNNHNVFPFLTSNFVSSSLFTKTGSSYRRAGSAAIFQHRFSTENKKKSFDRNSISTEVTYSSISSWISLLALACCGVLLSSQLLQGDGEDEVAFAKEKKKKET